MSKAIKITDEVRRLIEKYQAPRETYSEVIQRAFAGLEALTEAREAVQHFPHLPERSKAEAE